MKITIIGNGNMARGIATRLLAAGHAVTEEPLGAGFSSALKFLG